MTWRLRPDGRWAHRPWWKVAVNTVLRFFQGRGRAGWKVVIATRVDDSAETPTQPPRVLGYRLQRVYHHEAPR